MGLLTPTRRVFHRWRLVIPLQDGKECPDCGAVVCGREGRRLHREWHMHTGRWQEWVGDTLMRLAGELGIPTVDLPREDQGGEGGRVDLRAPDYDEDEEDDE